MGSGARAQRIAKGQLIAQTKALIAQLVAERQDPSDIFFDQREKIDSLQEKLLEVDSDISYVKPAAQPIARPSKILPILAIGVVVLILTGKIKL